MPTYTYMCDMCATKTERIAPIMAVITPPECAACDRTMRRTYEPPATIFRGTGWGSQP